MKINSTKLLALLLTLHIFLPVHAGNPQRNGPQIGDFYQGGVVYWVDQTKEGQHGLIADVADKGTFVWGSCTPNNTSNGVYTGQQNTRNIIAACPSSPTTAAFACASSTSSGFRDWYLPSIMELSFMTIQQLAITQTALAHGGSPFASVALWNGTNVVQGTINYLSSTEYDATRAWCSVLNAQQQVIISKTTLYSVRCIRAF